MASIAQLLAAKKKLATGPAPAPDDTQEAVDRISPGKRQSIVLTRSPEKVVQPQPQPMEIEVRSLAATDGELVPVVPTTATAGEIAWHQAMNSFETDLVLMPDPIDPERGWIAIRAKGMEQHPILLKSFPLYQHPQSKQDPF